MALFIRVLVYLVLAYLTVVGLQLALGSATPLGFVMGVVLLICTVLAVSSVRRRPL